MRVVSGKNVFSSLREIVNPSHSALIVVDVQNDFCSDSGHFDRHGKDISMCKEMIPTLIKLLEEARKMGLLIVFIKQTTLPNGLSDSPAWLYLKTRDGKSPDYTLEGTWGQEFVKGVTPKENEIVVKKHRSSAFVGTNLDMILRCNDIKTTIFTGVVTQGCVESSARDAAFYNYYVVLVRDCIASTSKELHEASLKVMASRHDVISSEELIQIWNESKK